MKKLSSVLTLVALAGVVLAGVASADVWENDMSVDPAGNGWAVRNGANNYTVSGGLLIMGDTVFGTILDTVPDNEFQNFTTIDLEWRSTTVTTGIGAGLWINVNHDTDTYGSIRFDSLLLDDGSQTVNITDGSGTPLATLAGFGSGMLDLNAVIDGDAQSITYSLTDGTLSTNDVVNFTQVTSAAQPLAVTLFTGGPGAEIDYVKVENIAIPEPSSLVLVGLGSLGILIARRKQGLARQ